MSSHRRTPSVVPIGGQPFISPYAQVIGAHQEAPSEASMSSSSSSSNAGLGITISHNSRGSSSSSSGSGSTDRGGGSSPTSLHASHHQYGTSPSSPASTSSSSSSADAYTSVSPDGQYVSPLRARHEAAMRYAAAMHSHTTTMWQEERDNIERARLGQNPNAANDSNSGEDKWSVVTGLLRGRSSRRKDLQEQKQKKDARNAWRTATRRI